MDNRRCVAVGGAAFFVGACSGRTNPDPMSSSRSVASSTISTQALTVPAPAAEAGAPAADTIDYTWSAAIILAPGTKCTVHPQGASGDPSHTDYVTAGADGEARFYPPPPDWGTQLTFQCALNGTSQPPLLVDLNDGSTFKRETEAELTPHVLRTLPALTGDLSALSHSALRNSGYPPRPDPAASPDQYAHWQNAVTKSAQVFSVVLISALGRWANTYQGSITCNWTGFVQSANGFANLGCGIVTNYTGTLYQEYALSMPAPSSSCSTGCNSVLWGGIGGTNVNLSLFGLGVMNTVLIQSGFNLTGNSTGRPFIEYTPAGITNAPLPGGDLYSANDQFIVWGWSGNSDCSISLSGQAGCFGFWDVTKNWAFDSPSMNVPYNGGTFFPSSAEFISEYVSQQNPSYGISSMYGDAWDSNDNLHPDPGASGATDPYVYVQQNNGSGVPYSIAEWGNATVSSPQDPMFFLWGSF
jgi:hypothetical protein